MGVLNSEEGGDADETTEHRAFGTLTGVAVAKLAHILAIKVADSDLKFLGLQKDAAVSVLTLAIRADEARFRARSEGGLVAILEQVQLLRQQAENRTIEYAAEWASEPPPLLQ